MATKKKSAQPKALLDLKKLIHSRFDIDKFRSLVAEGLGGEEAMAKIFVQMIKDPSLKGGAKSSVSKVLLEVLQKKSVNDQTDVPPVVLLDSIISRYHEQKEQTAILCAKCQRPIGVGTDPVDPERPGPQPEGEVQAHAGIGPGADIAEQRELGSVEAVRTDPEPEVVS